MNYSIKPFDLSCISFKPLTEIKEKIIETLNNRKIKYRTPKVRISLYPFIE